MNIFLTECLETLNPYCKKTFTNIQNGEVFMILFPEKIKTKNVCVMSM